MLEETIDIKVIDGQINVKTYKLDLVAHSKIIFGFVKQIHISNVFTFNSLTGGPGLTAFLSINEARKLSISLSEALKEIDDSENEIPVSRN